MVENTEVMGTAPVSSPPLRVCSKTEHSGCATRSLHSSPPDGKADERHEDKFQKRVSMSTLKPMQSRLGELSTLENKLWRAFKRAEAEYVPPVFNPWTVTQNFLRLRRHGYLRWYEFYPIYALVGVTAGVDAVFVHRWLFAVYIVSLVPLFVFLSRYVKQFAFEKTNMLGLDRYSFGVPHLPLLVYGMAKHVAESTETEKDFAPALPTKENLAAVAKLIKGGHEHGEIGYGFNDAAKKWLFGGVASALVFASTKTNEVAPTAQKIWHLALTDPRFSAGAILIGTVAASFLYQVVFSAANDKRRKRRYLLAINVMQEAQSAEEV